jgi:large subunit ribosomal protein L24
MNKLKVNDIVEVITGDSKGKQGRILRFNTDRSRAFVDNINVAKRHSKPSPKNPSGGIVDKVLSIHTSNLMVVDPDTKKPGRVGIKILADKSRIRIMKKSGKELKSAKK